MPTICPNCLRLVRSGATYCGFCGTNLIPPTPAEDGEALVVELASAEDELARETQAAKTTSRGSKVRRMVLILIIILLCLVLVAAFVVHYWSVINQYVGPLFYFLRGQ
jgi:RNA polymerase subunit RPABC4/transcription elongation factor Spt4